MRTGTLIRLIVAGVFPLSAFFAASGIFAAPASNAVPVSSTNAAYLANCAGCHGKTLRGTFGPSLIGQDFRSRWVAQDAAALRTFIAQSMPPAAPGSLSREDYDEITAFIRVANDMKDAGAGKPEAGAGAGAGQSSAEHKQPATENDKLTGGDVVRDARYHQILAERASVLAAIKPVSDHDLRYPAPDDWLSARRTDDGQAFSPLAQIERGNAASLRMAWSLALPVGTNGITPLVRSGVMFVNSNGTVLAIDVRSGDILWKFVRPVAVRMIGPPITQARGMAIFEDRLFVPTIDNHVLALDVRTGRAVWDHPVAEMQNWMRFSAAPIVVHGKVILGTSGCWSTGAGSKCFILGLDSATGKELWRFNTIPQPGEPGGDTWNGAPLDQRGGASIWSPGSYDPETNLIYFGTGGTYHISTLLQPSSERRRENAGYYNDTTLALNPDTGKLIWAYQHIARDVWDLDWAFERIVTTLPVGKKSRKVVMTMGKIGILDVLDARTGKYLFSYDLGFQNLVTAIDPVTGWKSTNPATEPKPNQPVTVCPYSIGVRNWPATSYDPAQHLLYIGATANSCMNFSWITGEEFDFSIKTHAPMKDDTNIGRLMAVNLLTRKLAWSRPYRAPVISSTLTTAGGLVFEGGRDRRFRASDSATGAALWESQLDNVPNASPITFAVDGVQYIAVTTGGGAPNDVVRGYMTPEIEPLSPSTTLWVFKLDAVAPSH